MDGTVSGASGDGEIGDARDLERTRACQRLTARLERLDPVSASCVWNVCCMEQGAEAWAARNGKPAHLGLLVLKAGLSGMFGRKSGV